MSPPPRKNRSVSRSRTRSPPPTSRTNGKPPGGYRVIVVSGLSKNVQREHLEEIFGEYGKVTGLDLPLFKVCMYPFANELEWKGADEIAGLNRGKAAVEFSEASEAEKAVKHMNGGQLDGLFLTIQVSPPLICGLS